MNVPAAGTSAPGFELRDHHGAPTRLADLRGRPVVLVFFPYAFANVCTDELRELRGGFGRDEAVLAVSCDSMFWCGGAWSTRFLTRGTSRSTAGYSTVS